MEVTFKLIGYGTPEWSTAVQLREKVLRRPYGIRFNEQELIDEQHHLHIAGYLDEQLIATAVLVPEGDSMKMQRVAVKDRHRNKQIGSRMMQYCEQFANENGVTSIYCHARNTAVDFYLGNGYLSMGDYFSEDGIPHLKMEKVVLQPK